MKLSKAIYSFLASRLTQGQARANHPRIETIAVNGGFTGVLIDNQDAGLAMNIRAGNSLNASDVELLRGLIGVPALEVGRLAFETPGGPQGFLLTSLGIAALSALSQPFLREPGCLTDYGIGWRPSGFQEVVDRDVSPCSVVTMVGFGGAVRQVAQKAKAVYVPELAPDLFRSLIVNRNGARQGPCRVHLLPAQEVGEALSGADLVLITACTLVSQTLDQILDLCASRAKPAIIYGPTASLVPHPFFLHPQVTKVTTLRVTNGVGLMEILAEGGVGQERFFGEVSENLTFYRTGDGNRLN
ncbi:MAG: hypothetical protein H5U02_14485 [Clostridia bacterium]|nr:hypothetical protein [Clostridia bacterium]